MTSRKRRFRGCRVPRHACEQKWYRGSQVVLDEQLLRRFHRIPQVPYGYSLIETHELRQLQALREQRLTLPAPSEATSIKSLPRRAVA